MLKKAILVHHKHRQADKRELEHSKWMQFLLSLLPCVAASTSSAGQAPLLPRGITTGDSLAGETASPCDRLTITKKKKTIFHKICIFLQQACSGSIMCTMKKQPTARSQVLNHYTTPNLDNLVTWHMNFNSTTYTPLMHCYWM